MKQSEYEYLEVVLFDESATPSFLPGRQGGTDLLDFANQVISLEELSQ